MECVRLFATKGSETHAISYLSDFCFIKFICLLRIIIRILKTIFYVVGTEVLKCFLIRSKIRFSIQFNTTLK